MEAAADRLIAEGEAEEQAKAERKAKREAADDKPFFTKDPRADLH